MFFPFLRSSQVLPNLLPKQIHVLSLSYSKKNKTKLEIKTQKSNFIKCKGSSQEIMKSIFCLPNTAVHARVIYPSVVYIINITPSVKTVFTSPNKC